MNPTSASSKKSNSLSDKDDNENTVAEMDENELQALLEEAMNYKKPSDIETKSECFKKLLKSTTEEDERMNSVFEQWLPKKRSRNQHGGSLQDLPEASSNEFYGNTYSSIFPYLNHSGAVSNSSSHSGGKKHSRRKHSSTSSSSVSSRQREGGSLPNNVNMPPTPIDYFFNDCRKSSKKSGKNDSKIEKPQSTSLGAYTVIDMGDIGDIDEKQHLLAHDSLGISSTQHNNEGGIEMKPLSYTNSLNLEIGTSGDCSKKPFRSTIASSLPATTTTYMTTGTTITSPAITGAKSSTTSSITSSSSTGPMTSFGTMSVDKGIEYNIEKPKSYQQQNHVYITNSSAMSSSNIVTNAGLHNGPTDTLPKSQVVITTPLQLQQGYNAVSCLVDRGFPLGPKSSTTSQRVDEPTNSLLPSMSTPAFGPSAPATGTNSHTTSSTKERKDKQKRSKHERNVTTFTADSIQGSRGNEDLDSLLSFIENNSNKDDKKESKPKNGFLNNELLNSENKLKKSQTKNKEKSEKVHQKLKKCSSLEELSSANRNSNKDSSANNKSSAEHNSNNVTLRSKSSNTNSKDKENKKNSSNNNNNSNTNSSTTSEKVNNKRNERRSWGTEELNYLGESSMDLQKKLPTEPPTVVKPKEASVKDLDKKNANDSSSSSSSGAFESLSIVSIEQIASNTLETAEFHVVTKKRKTKKRTNEEIHASVKINPQQLPKRDNYQNRGNYKQQQTSQDKSAGTAKGDGKSGKNRRKSTSSVPPSEKSDDSDMDSVHSLPVKSTKTTSSLLSAGTTHHHHHNHNQQQQQQPQPQQSKTQKHTEDINAKNHKQKLNMIMSPPIVSPQPVKTTASPSSQISYADMAKKISSNNNSNNILNSSNKLDKTSNSNDQWPSVSSTNRLSSELVGTSSFPFSTSTGSVTPPITTIINQNTQNIVEKKKTTTGKLSYPELVECNNTKNKLLNNSVEHEIVNSQDTNNNNEPKKTIISYSQSLLDDNGNIKLINEDKPSTLHKSKSFDQPTTTVVDPFPALEKTLTKQQSQKSLNDPPPQKSMVATVKTVKNPNEGAKKLKSPNGKIGNGLGPTAVSASLKMSTSSPGNLENAMKIHPEPIKVDGENVEKKIKKDKGPGLTNGSIQRPAVIILNYPNRKTSDDEDISSITFGFDIDEHLLHSSDDETAATNQPSTQGNNECSSLVNIKTNYCDIIDKSLNNSSNCNDLEENFIVNNASNISSNLIKNQSSPKQLLEHEMAHDNDGGKSRETSDLEVSQSSNDLGYSSLVTNPSPKDPKKGKSQPQVLKNDMELEQMVVVDEPINHVIELQNNITTSVATEQNSHCHSDSMMIGTTKNSMIKKEQTFVPSALPKFIDPEGLQSFTFNHEKIVHFVGEEWDKFIRNGVKYFEEL